MRSSRKRWSAGRARGGYTLVEVLIVVTILGIAGAMVVPAFSQTGVLRTQAAVRTIVSDITTAQSDALAMQTGRAIQFTPSGGEYRIAEVRSPNVDFSLDLLGHTVVTGETYGHTTMTSARFGAGTTLYLDEMGSPETAAMSGIPASAGYVEVEGSGQRYRITVEAYTGRVTVSSQTIGP